jgi:hypothetical protein
MNENYARKGQFFPDTDGVRRAAEAVSHADLGWFFQKYVAGTEEIPWDDFFKNVGLHLSPRATNVADVGFVATRTSTLRWWCLPSRREAQPMLPALRSEIPFWRSMDRKLIAGSPHVRKFARVIPSASGYATLRRARIALEDG